MKGTTTEGRREETWRERAPPTHTRALPNTRTAGLRTGIPPPGFVYLNLHICHGPVDVRKSEFASLVCQCACVSMRFTAIQIIDNLKHADKDNGQSASDYGGINCKIEAKSAFTF